MMKKYIAILILTLACACGCSKFLDPEQVDLIYNEVFWKTQTDAEVGLSGTYALYRGLMANSNNWYSRADATTGFIRAGWNGGSSQYLYTNGIYTDIANPSKMWGSLEDYSDWSNFYKVVAQANMVIRKIDEIPDSKFKEGQKDRILGEAYFLRALVYFNILRIWGNAPYISDMIESSSQVIDKDLSPVVIPRTEDIDICQNVLADVNKAVELLKFNAPGGDGWGITADKGAALALCGHVNMWMWFLVRRDRVPGVNASDYVKAAVTALEDFRDHSNRSYVQYTDMKSVQSMYRGGSTEAVFELNISTESSESYRADMAGVTARTCKMESFDGDPMKDRSTQIDWVPASQKAKMYPEYDFATQTGDIRPKLFFDAWDSEYNEPVNDTGGAENDRTKVTWLTKYAMFTADKDKKVDEYVAYFAEANIPIFRYTDIMLLLAEAYVRNKQYGKAAAIVNDIRGRAKIGDYKGDDSGLADEIMQQRIAELFGEGCLYFDMVRNNYFPNDHLMAPAKYKQEGYYWPVSSSIMKMNPLISQTPYWDGKTRW